MYCPLFVTAASADHKIINRFLLTIWDWEYGSGNRMHLVTTKNGYKINDPENTSGRTCLKPNEPPVPANLENGWTGAAISDIEEFLIDAEGPPEYFYQYMILDDQGVRDRTVILADRVFNSRLDRAPKEYNRARVSWYYAYSMWCNLEIGNMNFEDWCEEPKEGEDPRWYTFTADFGNEISEEHQKEKDEKFKEAEEEGWI